MDGTLTETNQLIYDSFNYIAQKYAGKTYTIPEINAMFGPPKKKRSWQLYDRVRWKRS